MKDNNLIRIDNIIVNLNEIQALTYYDTGDTEEISYGYYMPIYKYQLSLKGKSKPVDITESQYKKLLEIIK